MGMCARLNLLIDSWIVLHVSPVHNTTQRVALCYTLASLHESFTGSAMLYTDRVHLCILHIAFDTTQRAPHGINRQVISIRSKLLFIPDIFLNYIKRYLPKVEQGNTALLLLGEGSATQCKALCHTVNYHIS